MATVIVAGNSVYKWVEDPDIHSGKLVLQVYPASGNSPAQTILAHKAVKSSITGDILWECDKGEVHKIPKGNVVIAYVQWDVSCICIGDWVEEEGRAYEVLEVLEFSNHMVLALKDCNTPHKMIHRSIIKEQTK
jgi:hypothetical protein